jgi:FSR family fosmidomycin resistance protein-like MFS transporter
MSLLSAARISAKSSSYPSSDEKEPAFGFLSGKLLGMSWAHLLNDGAANYLPGILPALLVNLQQPVSMAGAFMAALILVQSLQPLSGLLADRIGGKSLILVGFSLSIAGGALLGFSPNIWAVIAVLAMIGAGNTLFHPQSLAAVRSLPGTRTGKRMAFFLIGGEIGRGLWPSVTSFLIVTYGMPALWLTAIPAILTFPLLVRWTPSLPKRDDAAPRIEWRRNARPLAAVIIFGSVRSFSIYGAVTFIPILWHLQGGSLVAGASIITTLLVVGIIGNFAGGHIADRFGFHVPLTVAALIGGASIALVPSAGYGAMLWVVASVIGIALFSSMPILVLVAQNVFAESRAMGSGVAIGASNAIGAAALFLVGLLSTRFGVAPLLYIVASASLLTVIGAALLPREKIAR